MTAVPGSPFPAPSTASTASPLPFPAVVAVAAAVAGPAAAVVADDIAVAADVSAPVVAATDIVAVAAGPAPASNGGVVSSSVTPIPSPSVLTPFGVSTVVVEAGTEDGGSTTITRSPAGFGAGSGR